MFLGLLARIGGGGSVPVSRLRLKLRLEAQVVGGCSWRGGSCEEEEEEERREKERLALGGNGRVSG